jgi:hypothetical protein
MDEMTRKTLHRSLTAQELYTRTYSVGDHMVSVTNVAGGGFVNVSVRDMSLGVPGFGRVTYSYNHVFEQLAIADFVQRIDELERDQVEATPEELGEVLREPLRLALPASGEPCLDRLVAMAKRGREIENMIRGAVDLTDTAMDDGGRDRQILLEHLIRDIRGILRGGDSS